MHGLGQHGVLLGLGGLGLHGCLLFGGLHGSLGSGFPEPRWP